MRAALARCAVPTDSDMQRLHCAANNLLEAAPTYGRDDTELKDQAWARPPCQGWSSMQPCCAHTFQGLDQPQPARRRRFSPKPQLAMAIRAGSPDAAPGCEA